MLINFTPFPFGYTQTVCLHRNFSPNSNFIQKTLRTDPIKVVVYIYDNGIQL